MVIFIHHIFWIEGEFIFILIDMIIMDGGDLYFEYILYYVNQWYGL